MAHDLGNLQIFNLAVVVVPPVAWWYTQAPAWLAAVQLTAILTLLSMVAWWMHRRRLMIQL